jgi:LysM repeat protein
MARGTIALLGIGIALLTVACGGETTPTATAVSTAPATATPFATFPTTTILTGSEVTPAPEVTYTVVAGDSLGLIAEQHGTTVEAIQTLNELTGTNIFVDQELLIPSEDGGNATGTATPRPTPAIPDGTTVYVVDTGDSGFGIALEYEISLEQLAMANGLSVDQLGELFVGQELLIPTP